MKAYPICLLILIRDQRKTESRGLLKHHISGNRERYLQSLIVGRSIRSFYSNEADRNRESSNLQDQKMLNCLAQENTPGVLYCRREGSSKNLAITAELLSHEVLNQKTTLSVVKILKAVRAYHVILNVYINRPETVSAPSNPAFFFSGILYLTCIENASANFEKQIYGSQAHDCKVNRL